MKILGVDPGIRGGLSVVEIIGSTVPRLIEAIDIPTVGMGPKERVDPIAVREWVSKQGVQHCYIERAQSMPRQGSSSGFKYGRAVGAIEAAIALSGIPVTIVEPSAWKKFHKLPGKEKELSRQRALQLFPTAHSTFALKRSHGLAEAALLALYGARQ